MVIMSNKHLNYNQVVRPGESISHALNRLHRARQAAIKENQPTENLDAKIAFLMGINGSNPIKPVKPTGSKYVNYSGVVKSPMSGGSMSPK